MISGEAPERQRGRPNNRGNGNNNNSMENIRNRFQQFIGRFGGQVLESTEKTNIFFSCHLMFRCTFIILPYFSSSILEFYHFPFLISNKLLFYNHHSLIFYCDAQNFPIVSKCFVKSIAFNELHESTNLQFNFIRQMYQSIDYSITVDSIVQVGQQFQCSSRGIHLPIFCVHPVGEGAVVFTSNLQKYRVLINI